jgi:hypothetical protein
MPTPDDGSTPRASQPSHHSRIDRSYHTRTEVRRSRADRIRHPVRVSDDESGYPEVEVDGFQIGMFAWYGDVGDAWVHAPDESHCSLVWETGSPVYFHEVIAPDPSGRWGAWAVQQPLPMTTDEEAAEYLRALLPDLRLRWEQWRETR